ncbi:MAG TPA: hypothetical protein VFH56_07635 [Acidimicrobiales bacterium]|nr:hypothetical protein [Acidimicrobiales bacterium]
MPVTRSWKLEWRIAGDPDAFFRWWTAPENRRSYREQVREDKLRDFAWDERLEADRREVVSSWASSNGVKTGWQITERFDASRRVSWIDSIINSVEPRGGERLICDSVTTSVQEASTGILLQVDAVLRYEGLRALETFARPYIHKRKVKRRYREKLDQWATQLGNGDHV